MKWLKTLFGNYHEHDRLREGETQYEHGQSSHNDADNNFEESNPYDHGVGISKGTEDLDRAIALSLTEEEHNAHESNDSHIQSDEELAKALQASLDLDGRPRDPFNLGLFNPFTPYPAGTPSMAPPRVHETHICAGCEKPLGFGRFLSCMGLHWHPRCFRCAACNEPISENEFSVQGQEPYHKHCYKELFHPKCEVCQHFIPTNAQGLIEYRSHPFWGLKYCPAHERDGTPRCCSCDRIEPRHHQYVALDDGRKLCLECLDSVVMDTKECQPLYYDVLKFYKNIGMLIEQEIPMLLVERQALNSARAGERDGHRHTPETRGLCLSEEHTISTVYKKPKWKGSSSLIGMLRTESMKLERHCEVTAILVLYGLPRLLTGSILAHELMHAWLRLNGPFPTLSSEVEEGICQVMAHLWLRTQIGLVPSSSTMKKGNQVDQQQLGEFFMNQIINDPSPVYGDGFRTAQASVAKFGLKQTLEHIRLTSTFPI